jgi:uncharacterized protein (DUF58 family)
VNTTVSQRVDGDGRVSVSLAELIAMRSLAARLRLPPQESRTGRIGQQTSRLYGRGMDYAESRVYQPGDDVRRLDWRLTARSGKLHTKLFQEEREGNAVIVLDNHATMHFGTRVRYKSVQAARAAALAAWYTVRAGERIGLMTFGTDSRTYRPMGSARGALNVCGTLAEMKATPERIEPLSDALQRVTRLQHAADRVLLISDGFSCDDQARRRLLDLMRHSAVRVLIVADALELHSPPTGRYPLEHEGVTHEVVLQTSRQRVEFQRRLGMGQAGMSALAQSLNIPWCRIDTVTDPVDAIRTLMCQPVRRS